METKTLSKKDIEFFVNTIYPYKGLDELPDHICVDIMKLRKASELKECKRAVESEISEEFKRPDW